MPGRELDLNQRVKLADGREGFILGMTFQGPGPPLEVRVMTDDYVEVVCLPEQFKAIRRQGQTEVFEPYSGGANKKMLPVEIHNHEQLRLAVWHAHFKRFPPAPDSVMPHAESFRQGEIVPLPQDEDIRETGPQFPQQISLAL